MLHDKLPGGWICHRGRVDLRGEQSDYSQNFVDTGMRPQNFIPELELTSVVKDYPRLTRELIQRKDETVSMYYKCDLKEHMLSPDFLAQSLMLSLGILHGRNMFIALLVSEKIIYRVFPKEIRNRKIEVVLYLELLY